MLLLRILSLAASFLLPANGEVVRSFKTCRQFFLDGKPPERSLRPMNPARICQYYQGKNHFATMYDRARRIPLFSAYQYQPGRTGREDKWKIEPQLALPKERKLRSMELEETTKISHQLLAESQALSKDYKEVSRYDKGHLTPVAHQPNPESKAATFTLTNIVPQFYQLNQGKWAEYERDMARHTEGCHKTYVIVGVVPGDMFIAGRVNIPSHIWAAACCVFKDNRRKSWAVIAKNNENKVLQCTLRQLETQLCTLYQKRKIDLFNGACYHTKRHKGYSTERVHRTNSTTMQT